MLGARSRSPRSKVEELIFELKKDYTIVIVTHNMQQAARVSDYTGFFDLGRAGRVRRDRADLHEPGARAHRGLHHREIRMSRRRPSPLPRRAEPRQGAPAHHVGRGGGGARPRGRGAARARRARRRDAVIAGDRVIDSMEVEIEEQCINLLALQQPMARDLRMLTSALKIANDLERVGDHAVNIAQSRRAADRRPGPIAPEPEIVEMARLAREMLSRRPGGVHPGRRRRRPRGLPAGRQGGRAAPLGVPHPAHPHDGGPAHDRRRAWSSSW